VLETDVRQLLRLHRVESHLTPRLLRCTGERRVICSNKTSKKRPRKTFINNLRKISLADTVPNLRAKESLSVTLTY
jgi:hypothetical protein